MTKIVAKMPKIENPFRITPASYPYTNGNPCRDDQNLSQYRKLWNVSTFLFRIYYISLRKDEGIFTKSYLNVDG